MRPRHSFVRRLVAASSAVALVVGLGLVPVASVAAVEPTDMVRDWNLNAVNALSNANSASPPGAAYTPPVASIHLAIVQGAVYDAVNSIDRGHDPYLTSLRWAPRSASKAAAAATAAHDVLVGFTPALPQNVRDSLDGLYAASLAEIPAGPAKVQGINVGATVAKAMLKERADDGRFGSFRFTPATGIGEWRPTSVDPVTGIPINDPFGWVARVRPFTMTSTSQFRTAGPYELDSSEYATEFNEVKTLGSNAVPNPRSEEQTQLARFVSANPVPFMNRGFREVAAAQGNSIDEDARFFAMTSMSSADALIGCWDDKDHWNFWRPVTAIREAAGDGNDATEAQADWTPFFTTPPYPDHPSGYNCFTAGMMHAAVNFFGTDDIAFQLTSPAPMQTNPTRSYAHFTDVIDDTIDGRIYTGFHFRNPDVQGALLGENVANWVADHYFGPVD